MSGRRHEFRSRPALVTGAVMSTVLIAFSLVMWFALGDGIRSQFTWPQVATLAFFLLVIVGMMMAVGLSSIVVDDQGLTIRNAVWTRRFGWDQVLDAHIGDGDPWAYVSIAPDEDHPEGRTQMALAIQRSEGAGADAQVERLRALIAEHTGRVVSHRVH